MLPQFKEQFSFLFIELRGHGLNFGRRADLDQIDQFSSDIHEIYAGLNLKEEMKLIIFGAGFGGLIALDLIQRSERFCGASVKGGVFVNPILGFKKSFYHKNPFNLYSLTEGVAVKLLGQSPLVDMTSSKTSLEELERDILVTDKIPLKLIEDVDRKAREIQQNVYYIDIPCLFLLSSINKVTSYDACYLFQKGINKNLVTFHELKKSYHGVFHDVEKKKAITLIIDWLKVL